MVTVCISNYNIKRALKILLRVQKASEKNKEEEAEEEEEEEVEDIDTIDKQKQE